MSQQRSPKVGDKILSITQNTVGEIVDYDYCTISVVWKGHSCVFTYDWPLSSSAQKEFEIQTPNDISNAVKREGYHLNTIEKGEVGEISKIREEVEELIDAENQKNPVMALVELSDIIGAIELFLEKHHPSITVKDLITMSEATKRAFLSGARK